MRKKLNKIITFNLGTFLLFAAIPVVPLKADLVEINRVMAKVENRIVTRGEVDKAMDMLNFTKAEKDSRAKEFVDGKIDRLLAIAHRDRAGRVAARAFAGGAALGAGRHLHFVQDRGGTGTSAGRCGLPAQRVAAIAARHHVQPAAGQQALQRHGL